jgi:hypothetical protein
MIRAAVVVGAVVAAAGCTQYAHRSMHNAPGVVDLSTPNAPENGAPERVAQPTDPGTDTVVVAVMPTILVGVGRLDTAKAAGEAGVELRFERTIDDGHALLHARAFAITAGAGLAQFSENRPTMFGAIYGELSYRSSLGFLPVDVGAGPAFYAGVSIPSTGQQLGPELGAQLTVRIPLLLVRARYMATSGAEIWFGYEIPFPMFFGRSR